MPVRLTYWATSSLQLCKACSVRLSLSRPLSLSLSLSVHLPACVCLAAYLCIADFFALCSWPSARLSELLNSLYKKNAYMTARPGCIRILQILERNADVFITRLSPWQISLSFSRFHTAKQFQTFSADAFSFAFWFFFPFFFFFFHE